jgi:hypothetical protein
MVAVAEEVAVVVVVVVLTIISFEQYESTTEYLWCLLVYEGYEYFLN